MAIQTKLLEVTSKNQFELIDISEQVGQVILDSGIKNGMAVIFNPHTTASIRLNHKEALLGQDIMKMIYRIAPVEDNYGHDLFEMRDQVEPNERSNGHAHVKAFLLGSSETVPVENSKLSLGVKQSLFFVECDGPRKRDYKIVIYGEQ